MTVLSRIIGFGIVLTIVIGGVAIGGRGAAFIHIPSAVVIVGIMFGGLFLSFRAGVAFRALGRGLGIGRAVSQEELTIDTMVFERGRQLVWAGSVLAFLIGLMLMMLVFGPRAGVSFPYADALRGLAICTLNLFYGLVLAEVILTPLKHGMIARSIGAAGCQARSDSRAATRVNGKHDTLQQVRNPNIEIRNKH